MNITRPVSARAVADVPPDDREEDRGDEKQRCHASFRCRTRRPVVAHGLRSVVLIRVVDALVDACLESGVFNFGLVVGDPLQQVHILGDQTADVRWASCFPAATPSQRPRRRSALRPKARSAIPIDVSPPSLHQRHDFNRTATGGRNDDLHLHPSKLSACIEPGP